MTAQKLIDQLKKLDPKAEVLVASDEEGNGFGKLVDVTPNMFYTEEDGNIEEVVDAEDKKELEEDGVSGFKKAIILWP